MHAQAQAILISLSWTLLIGHLRILTVSATHKYYLPFWQNCPPARVFPEWNRTSLSLMSPSLTLSAFPPASFSKTRPITTSCSQILWETCEVITVDTVKSLWDGTENLRRLFLIGSWAWILTHFGNPPQTWVVWAPPNVQFFIEQNISHFSLMHHDFTAI